MSVLSWPSGGGGGGSMRMHVPQFPALKLNERDVRRGAVKVIARSPSGSSQTLKIGSDSSGQFITNFTPNEVGECYRRRITLLVLIAPKRAQLQTVSASSVFSFINEASPPFE